MLVAQKQSNESSSKPHYGQQEDWEPPEVRQPTVMVRQAILSPQVRADLRRSLEVNSLGDHHDDTELRDEFISPEKSDD